MFLNYIFSSRINFMSFIVRSLSSIALRKASDKYNFHFNYFSVDLDEELNAVYGGVLEGQTGKKENQIIEMKKV